MREPTYKPIPISELKAPPSDWLDLEGVELEGIIDETDTEFVVQAHTCITSIPVCALCSSNNAVTAWDIRPRNIRDREQGGKLIVIVLSQQRYYCNTCEKAFTPSPPSLELSRLRRTNRLTKKAIILIHERQTTSYISQKTGLSRRTVQAIATATAEAQPTPQMVFIRATATEDAACVIQIDDAHPSLGPVTTILLNGKPLELLDAYNKEVIENFFFTLPFSHRKEVKVYVSDCASYLLALGHTWFPEALVVADPFHVIKKIRERFDASLKPFETEMLGEYVRAISEGRLVRPIRGKKAKQRATRKTEKAIKKQSTVPTFAEMRILLRTKRSELDGIPELAVKFLLDKFPEVRNGYDHLQGTMALYHTKMSSADASNALDRLDAELSPQNRMYFRKFLDLCREYRDEICAYWECGWSNAEAEAQNGVIKGIDRCGRGLEHPELRRRWLYGKSTTSTLGPTRLSIQVDAEVAIGPKKSIRELRSLQRPEPVPIVGLGGEDWIFDFPPQ